MKMNFENVRQSIGEGADEAALKRAFEKAESYLLDYCNLKTISAETEPILYELCVLFYKKSLDEVTPQSLKEGDFSITLKNESFAEKLDEINKRLCYRRRLKL